MAATRRKRRRRSAAAGSGRSEPVGRRDGGQQQQAAKPPGFFGRLVALVGRLWHWLVLLVSVVGAAVAGRLVLYGLQTADEAADQGEAVLWYGMAGGVAVVGLVFLREVWLRIVSLRRGQ